MVRITGGAVAASASRGADTDTPDANVWAPEVPYDWIHLGYGRGVVGGSRRSIAIIVWAAMRRSYAGESYAARYRQSGR